MQVNISTRHGHLSDASRDKIAAKAEKLSRIFERLTAIEITIDLQREDTPTVDLRVSAEHKHDFVAADTSSHLMGSVDTVIHKMEQQLRKYKEKIQTRHRSSSARVVEETGGEAEEFEDDVFLDAADE